MNRKLLVNEELEWETLNADDNEKILQVLENQLKIFPSLKRKNTVTKKKREIAKNDVPCEDNKKSLTNDHLFKKYIRIGINSVTKELEKNPKNVGFVLVCRTCKPILTRHLYIMCSEFDVRAGSIQSLSERLSKIFNFKTVSAFAICLSLQRLENDSNSTSNEIGTGIVELSNKISDFLPQLKKPFSLKPDIKRIIEEQNLFSQQRIEHLEIAETTKVEISNEIEEPMNIEENFGGMETFGSDFLSVEKSRTSESYVSFDSNFILFEDNLSENENETNQRSIYQNKRKLSSFFYQDGFSLNKMGVRYRTTNKNRQKLKRNTLNKQKTVKK